MTFSSDREAVRRLMDANKLEPFVRHIRFPYFRNLEQNSRIDFLFPFTAIVGVNGTNKSSVLRAIQSTPGQNSLGLYWFSTSTDEISDRGNDKPCFVYGYFHKGAQKVVEVLKTRVNIQSNPDYWEPSRPIRRYDMEAFDANAAPGNKGRTRWDTIDKSVVYIDFRQTLSAYDRSFYYGAGAGFLERKDFIRRRSPLLQRAIANDLKSYSWHGTDRVQENRSLHSDEVAAVSRILGRDYSEIRWLRHTFFNVAGATCVLRTESLKYTEAFAGSGEFAVVRLVIDILGAKPTSLILLDEPEVSLHPGAQERLVEFLFEQIKKQKHQVVVSTHSPSIIRHLPPEAIKVMMVDEKTGKNIIPSQRAAASEAFFRIGEPLAGRIQIIVEDVLAEHVVQRALSFDQAFANQFQVRFFPGGAETVWGHYVPVFSAENRRDVLILLDGDKAPVQPLPKASDISAADFGKLQEDLRIVAGTSVRINIDGGESGGNSAQFEATVRKIVDWSRVSLDYLSVKSPEEFIWTYMTKNGAEPEVTDQDYKTAFDKLARQELGLANFQPLDASDILSTQRRRLATIPVEHFVFEAIRNVARQAVERSS
jgi:predicted ATPase